MAISFKSEAPSVKELVPQRRIPYRLLTKGVTSAGKHGSMAPHSSPHSSPHSPPQRPILRRVSLEPQASPHRDVFMMRSASVPTTRRASLSPQDSSYHGLPTTHRSDLVRRRQLESKFASTTEVNVPLPTATRHASPKDGNYERSFNLATNLTVRALLIKGVSRAIIAKSGLSLTAMNWDMLENKNHQRPSATTHLSEEYYVQDLYGEEDSDLMKKPCGPMSRKFYQQYVSNAKKPHLAEFKDNTISTQRQPTPRARARPVAACLLFKGVRGALLANAQSQGPTSALCVLKPKIDSE